MLISFSGFKGSGKDTAAQVLVDEFGFTKIAFADALREALLVLNPIAYINKNQQIEQRLDDLVKAYGWDYSKNHIPEVRRLMQVFGSEVCREFFGNDCWIELLDKAYPYLSFPDTRYVLTDCRFKNEAQFVRDKLGTICWVNRPGNESDGHMSESDEVLYLADYFFTNDSSIEELQEDVRFMMHIRGVDPIEQGVTAEVN